LSAPRKIGIFPNQPSARNPTTHASI